jgi:hypothetical protein
MTREWWGGSKESCFGPVYKRLLPFNISLSVLMFADLQQINLVSLHELLSQDWPVFVNKGLIIKVVKNSFW